MVTTSGSRPMEVPGRVSTTCSTVQYNQYSTVQYSTVPYSTPCRVQVKRDLASGRLLAPVSTVCLLTSYAVQSTLGDWDPDSCRAGYLAPFR